MTRIPALRKQRGFTLVEALFSAIVLAIGLLALAGFHAVALKDGTLVKMRMVATNLAQEKLEDLKGFARLQDDPSTTSVDECASTSCYTAIAANAGGQLSSGSLALPSGSVTVSGTTYTRSWTATCYAAAAGSAPSVTTDCANADYKLANITIAWTDSQGAAQSTSLEGVIYGIDPANAARAMANPVPTAGPSVTYTGDTSGTTSTQLDQGTQRSSKPLPTVSSKGYSLSTSFETVIYDSSSKVVSRQENKTVNCVCQFAGSTGSAYPASYFYWNGSSLAIKTPSATVTKAYGTVPSIQGDTQDSLCGVCCRDHHDSEAPGTSNPTTALYDPDRYSYDYNGGDHKHYYYSTDTSGSTACTSATSCTKTNPLVAVSSGYYLESCRMIRVDGIWRAMQDWRMNDMVVMPKTYLDTSTNQTLYDTYKSNMMRYVAYSDCSTAGGTGCSSITQTSKPTKSSVMGTTRNLSVNTNDYNQLMAYGLYVDRVYKSTAPRTLDADYYTTLKEKIVAYQSDSSKLGWRDIMSFTEPNVTLFASWYSSTSSDYQYPWLNYGNSSVVSVKNDTIKNIDSSNADYYGVYYRGLTKAESSSGDAYVYAGMLPSNSGLNGGVTRETYASTGTNSYGYCSGGAADYYVTSSSVTPWSMSLYTVCMATEIGTDRLDTAFYNWSTGSFIRIYDKIKITNNASSSGSTSVNGLLTTGNSSANPAVTVTAVSSSGASTSCTVSTTGSTGSFTGTFNCPVGNNWSGTVTITSSATGAFFDHSSSTTDFTYDTEKNDGYQNSFTTSVTTSSDSSHQFWIFGPTVNVNGTLYSSGQAGSQVSCTDSSSTTCTVSSGSVITASSLTLDSGTHTWTGTVTLSNMSGKSNKIATPATSATDCNSATTTAKTTSSMTVGPTDGVSAFTFCAK